MSNTDQPAAPPVVPPTPVLLQQLIDRMNELDEARRPRGLDRFDTKSAIALLLVAGMMTIAFVLIFKQVPESDTFKMLLGGMMTVGFSSIINYFFGSSDGSKEKDRTIGEIAKSGSA